jgi:hypothetical protein
MSAVIIPFPQKPRNLSGSIYLDEVTFLYEITGNSKIVGFRGKILIVNSAGREIEISLTQKTLKEINAKMHIID